jgi:hypothetical protein
MATSNTAFNAKNGLVANGNLIYAIGGTGQVGINNSAPDANVTITGNANVQGNAVITQILSTNNIIANTVNASATVNTNTVNATNTNSNTFGIHTGNVNATVVNASANVYTNSVFATNVNSNTFGIHTGNVSATVVNASANVNTNTVFAINVNATGVTASANVNTNTVYAVNVTANVVSVNSVVATANLTTNTVFSVNVTANVVSSNVLNATANVSTNTVFTTNVNAVSVLATNVVANTFGIHTGNVNATVVNASANVNAPTVYANIAANTVNATANISTNTVYATNVVATNITGNVAPNNLTVAANTTLNGPVIVLANTQIGNSSVNSSLTVTGNLYVSGTTTIAGTVNAQGSVVPGVNNLYNLGSPTLQWATAYVNGISVSTVLSVGNSTVNTFSNATHFFSGNSTYYGFGNSTADVIVSPTANITLTPATINIQAGPAALITLGNSTVSATINSTAFSGTANNASNLGGVPAASFATTAGLAANIAAATANSALYFGGAPPSAYVNTSANFTLSGTLTFGNSTVNSSINSTSFSGVAATANNTNYVGTVSAANVVSNAQLQANIATVISTLNVSTLTANNANYLGGVAANTFVTATTLASNLSNYFNLNTNNVITGIDSIVGANTTAMFTNHLIGGAVISSSPAANQYYKIATLPASSNTTSDNILIRSLLNTWTDATRESVVFLVNRGAFEAIVDHYGTQSVTDARIVCYQETTNAVSVYILQQNGYFTTTPYQIYGNGPTQGSATGATLYENPTAITAPTGSLVFDSYTATPRMYLAGGNTSATLQIGGRSTINSTTVAANTYTGNVMTLSQNATSTTPGLLITMANSVASNPAFLELQPTDYAAGKPAFAIQKYPTANAWGINLWDGGSSNGTINIGATNLTINGGVSINSTVVAASSLNLTGTANVGSLLTGGFVYSTINTNGTKPPISNQPGWAMATNYAVGQAEVDFFNTSNNSAYPAGFNWYNYNNANSYTQILRVDGTGNLTAPGTVFASGNSIWLAGFGLWIGGGAGVYSDNSGTTGDVVLRSYNSGSNNYNYLSFSNTGNLTVPGSVTAGAITSSGGFSTTGVTGSGNFTAIAGGSNAYYGAGFYNNGTSAYLLSTNVQTTEAAANTAGWNSYRPFAWSFNNGQVTIDGTGAGVFAGSPGGFFNMNSTMFAYDGIAMENGTAINMNNSNILFGSSPSIVNSSYISVANSSSSVWMNPAGLNIGPSVLTAGGLTTPGLQVGNTTTATVITLESSIQGNASPSITSNAYHLLGGGGGNYLAFGQQPTNFAQWIQSGYGGGNAVYYPMVLNPLGGNVGIGTGTPNATLAVNGSANISGAVAVGGVLTVNSIINMTAPGSINPGIAWNDGVYVYDSNGSGGLSIRTNNSGTYYYSGFNANGTFTSAQDVIAYSDARLKENIKTIENAKTTIQGLRGVSFDWIKSGCSSLGFIAQEVQKVVPDLVHPVNDPEDGEILTVAYTKAIPILVEALKETMNEVDELKEQVKAMMKRIEKLEMRND